MGVRHLALSALTRMGTQWHESVLSTSTVCGPGGPGPGGHDIARAATSANPESMGAMVGSITYCWVLRAVNILLVTDRLRVLTVYMLW